MLLTLISKRSRLDGNEDVVVNVAVVILLMLVAFGLTGLATYIQAWALAAGLRKGGGVPLEIKEVRA